MSAPDFTVDVFQNEYLPVGACEVHAIVTVSSAGSAADGPAAAASAAEIIIIDCSGSMGLPMAKMDQARKATDAAIDAIRDGVAFAVVAGNWRARPAYPEDGTLAVADANTREAAKVSLARLHPAGGTAMGKWLLCARELFATREDALRHAILLTDGQNTQFPGRLAAAIRQCEGYFRCDCRGVGTDWKVSELRKISTALLASVDIVPDPAGLAADFEAMMQASMAKEVAGIALRVWTPQRATVRFVKQVAPAVEDLTGRRAQAAPQAGDYPTGSWGAESRDYHICVDVEPGAAGQEMLAARVSLTLSTASGSQTLGRGLVRAIWTDDEALSTRISRHVAHYTGQAELAQAIQDGIEARKAGDEDTAAARLGRAVALAHESGNKDTAHLLAKVVDVIDPASGTIRLKAKVADADEMMLDTRSTKTVQVRK
jgi:von Willebrand factor type A C-terminal domain/von Willebrand factor type A domain